MEPDTCAGSRCNMDLFVTRLVGPRHHITSSGSMSQEIVYICTLYMGDEPVRYLHAEGGGALADPTRRSTARMLSASD